VVVIGEDVAAAAARSRPRAACSNAFGTERVLDTPISEAAIVSARGGRGAVGLRPVVEIMFMDFITLGDGRAGQPGRQGRFMFGGQGSVPMVLRTPHGGGLSAGPQHSQCLEAWLAHVPG
jgi:pyruvate/2-oxoglutarate/acetoin dehydrogenase E1 component